MSGSPVRMILIVAVLKDGTEKKIALYQDGTADAEAIAGRAAGSNKAIEQFNVVDVTTKPHRIIDVLVPGRSDA